MTYYQLLYRHQSFWGFFCFHIQGTVRGLP